MFFIKRKEKALIVINGIFEGTINFHGKVVIADTGFCKIDIICDELNILGQLEGNIDVGKLTVYDKGIYHGSAKYRQIKVMQGACIKFEDVVSEIERESFKLKESFKEKEPIKDKQLFKEQEPAVKGKNEKVEKQPFEIHFRSSF